MKTISGERASATSGCVSEGPLPRAEQDGANVIKERADRNTDTLISSQQVRRITLESDVMEPLLRLLPSQTRTRERRLTPADG